jgi:predicted TIM-barrel fold metal-dependent hydrolase
MIIDVHAHAFPNQGGPAGYNTKKEYQDLLQERVHRFWGRMVTNTLDKKYMALPGEDVNFHVGKYGKWYWTKHDKLCWLQRYPIIVVEPEWPPEQMIAFMDATGVDKAVLQAGYMEPNFCVDFFSECIRKFPNRFIGTIATNYDIEKSEESREIELMKLKNAVLKKGMKGLFQGYPREQNVLDERFEPFWEEISRLKVPQFIWTGFQPKEEYLQSLERLEALVKRYPEMDIIIGHLGGNVRTAEDPNFTNTPEELLSLLQMPNVYFEVGYVLAFENWDIWKENYEYPYPLHNQIIEKVYEKIGADRLLWGSDTPYIYRGCTYKQCQDLVRLHMDFLSESEKDLVLGGNAEKLFNV